MGNLYDKYGTNNPLARRLMAGFLRSVSELYLKTAAESVLEVGCGEGRLSQHLFDLGRAPQRFDACDLSLSRLAVGLPSKIGLFEASAYRLPLPSRSYDLVICCEVLEHLEAPPTALAEITRIARRFVLLSTPREPIWRVLNLLRGSYVTALGNTPGHIQHFSRKGLLELARPALDVTDVRCPLPWTIVLGKPHGWADQ